MPLTGEYELSPASWVRDQTEKIFETGTTDSVDIKGRPVVLVTMRGAKSGKLRKVPLMRVEHDGVYAIVASKGGAPTNPDWYANLMANPDIDVEIGTETIPVHATEVQDDREREDLYARVVERRSGFAEYPEKSGGRRIPVIALDRRSNGS